MRKACIPYGAYWSTPFARWQGSFSGLHALRLAAWTAERELSRRDIDLKQIDYGVLGTTIPQPGSFYGLPWVTGLMGADHIGGPTINQACATGARITQMAAQEIRDGISDCALVVSGDRTSNGPTLSYPNPGAPGGANDVENWVLDNFARDPYARVAMVETAENVATKFSLTTGEQHDVVERRHAQYISARDRGFHERYMTLPFEVPDARFRKTVNELSGDEGIVPSQRDKMDSLRPVVDGGTVTYAGQTHPADGSAGMLVTTQARAEEISKDKGVSITLEGFGMARTDKAHMPYAPVPAANAALKNAGISIGDISAVTTHNPFAVNDLVFSRETGFDVMQMNNNGCSLIWGHPQGPTGLRAIIELVEELVERGGGNGLFTGCAAGDTAMACVVRVN